MPASITINPVLTSNALGSFSTLTTGGVQGTFHDDPVARNLLRSGVVAPAATQPFWGGLAVSVTLPVAGTEAQETESILALSVSAATILGFTVFNQSTAMIQSPQSTAPQAGATMAINYFLTGSGARIWLKSDAGVAAALAGGTINPTLYWDPTNLGISNSAGGNYAMPAGTELLDVNIGNSKVVTYSSGTGFSTWGYGDAVLIKI